MLKEKELLFEDIKHYSIILDDYINKRYKYTLNTEYLNDEIKVISDCLIETINDYEKILINEETKSLEINIITVGGHDVLTKVI